MGEKQKTEKKERVGKAWRSLLNVRTVLINSSSALSTYPELTGPCFQPALPEGLVFCEVH